MGIFDLDLGGIVKGIGSVADDLVTSDEERLQMELDNKKIDADLLKGQMAINQTEATHKSIFVAGWRPAVGWVCVASIAYQFIAYPFLIWIWTLAQGMGWVPSELDYPPILDIGALLTLLTGMLGISAIRSYDKAKGTVTDSIE